MAPPDTAAHLLKTGVAALKQGGQFDDVEIDARTLLAIALGKTPNALLLDLETTVSPTVVAGFLTMIEKRVAGMPVSRIIGRRAFWDHEFTIDTATLDPRADTETLVAHALAILTQPSAPPTPRILDLGTGTGCILISLLAELPGATGTGTDISPKALAVARTNAAAAGVASQAAFHQSDWFTNVTGSFDMIVSNPPYIPHDDIATLMPEVRLHDPRVALDGGADGLDAYRSIIAGAPSHLERGWLICEAGIDQAADIGDLMQQAGLRKPDGVAAIFEDLAGIPRSVAGFISAWQSVSAI
ncbi:MAG: peptide chain release factor N(5)-glutamine methyltransferase [Pseudomonadota bacterium]